MRIERHSVIRGFRVEVQLLADHLGGGFVAYAPSLTGCLSDGETPEESLHNLDDAIVCWLRSAVQDGETIPVPDVAYVA